MYIRAFLHFASVVFQHIFSAVFYWHNWLHMLTLTIRGTPMMCTVEQWISKYNLLVFTNKLSVGIVLKWVHLCCRYLLWSDYQHTIQVKSVQMQSQQNPCVPTQYSPLVALIVFKTHPIRLKASMIIDKQVCITTGNDNTATYKDPV